MFLAVIYRDRVSDTDSVDKRSLLRLGSHLPQHIHTVVYYVQVTSRQADLTAAGVNLKKQHKHHDIGAGVDFTPYVIKTSGVWGTSNGSRLGDRT